MYIYKKNKLENYFYYWKKYQQMIKIPSQVLVVIISTGSYSCDELDLDSLDIRFLSFLELKNKYSMNQNQIKLNIILFVQNYISKDLYLI